MSAELENTFSPEERIHFLGAFDSSCTLFSQDFSLSRPATSSHESAPQTSPFQQLAGSFE